MSIQHVTATGGFAYGAVGADIHVFGDGTPLYLLRNWRPSPEPEASWLAQQPSRMLNARFAVVPFTGRDRELAALRAWCTEGPRRAARWLHAPGGQGKTRLAHQLAHELDERGWKVVTAVEGAGSVLPPPGSQDLRLDDVAGLLLLVDYADRWALTSLTWLFSNALLHQPRVPTRVLLLARGTDPWPALRAALANEQMDTSSQALPPLAEGGGERSWRREDGDARLGSDDGDPHAAPNDGSPHPAPGYRDTHLTPNDGDPHPVLNDGSPRPAPNDRDTHLTPSDRNTHPAPNDRPPRQNDRDAMFRAALGGFAARYGIEPPSQRPDLTHPDFGLTLAVHMAALVAVDARATGRRAPQDLAGLTVYLLDREQLAWALLHDKRGSGRISTPSAVMNQVVYAASLGGAQPAERGRILVEDLRLGRPATTVLADHAVCYPPPDPTGDTVLEPLYPDRLAEDFVALTLPGHPADYPAQPWAPDTAATVLRHGGGPARPVTTLATAAGRWPHVGHTCLYPLLSADPGLAVTAGGATLTALAGLPDIEPGLLEDIVARVPDPVPTDLTVGRAAILVRLFEHRLAATNDPAAQARLFVNHGNNLTDLGRLEESLEAGRHGAELFGELAAADPQEYEQHVGRSLTNVADQLARLGRTDEALSTQRQVLEIFERLAETDPEAYAPDLAVALANLAAELEHSGFWEEAYRANERATQTYRTLAARDPQYRRGLAIALTNGAAMTFRPPDAADALREAVALSRELTADGTPLEDTTLPQSLLALHKELSADGRHAESIAVAEEAAAINRRLAEANPLHYAESYASALMELHSGLLDAGRPEEAVAVGEEAISVWRRLAYDAPATYESRLLGALHAQNDARLAAGLPKDPEAHARSPRVDLDRAVRVPAATITVHGWRPTPSARRSPPPPGMLDTEAERLARTRNWPAYWELVCAAPLIDALRLVRRIPRRGWSPALPSDRELLRWLRATPRRRTEALLAEAAQEATRLLPEDFGLYSALYCAFAHGGAVMAMAQVVRPPGGRTTDTSETIETLDLGSGRRTVLHQGPVVHASLACLGPADVVAVRHGQGRHSTSDLVRHRPDGTTVLARGEALRGLRVVGTATGCVAGLALAPTALVLDAEDELRQVDLREWGLVRADRAAVTPAGDRMVLSDGHRLIATDTALSRALAAAAVPPEHAQVRDLVFTDEDLLVTAGRRGGLMLWQLGGFEIEPVAHRDTVPLSELFAVPAWGVIGGKAPSEDRVHFFAPTAGLPSVAAPPALIGDPTLLKTVAAPPGGRYVVYSGQFDVTAPRRHRSFARLTRLHDLHHPAALLQRPLTTLDDTELTTLSSAHSTDPRMRDLLRLALALAWRA